MSTSLSLAVSMITGTVGPRAQRAADLGARQARQHQVEQHEVGTAPVELLEGRRSGLGEGDLEALLAQHVGQRVAERLFVLDDKDPGHTFSWLVGRISGVYDRGRQPQGEGGAGALVAPHGGLAAVAGGHVLDDGESEPGAAGLPGAGRVDAVEAFEDAVALLLGDAGPLVGDADLGDGSERPHGPDVRPPSRAYRRARSARRCRPGCPARSPAAARRPRRAAPLIAAADQVDGHGSPRGPGCGPRPRRPRRPARPASASRTGRGPAGGTAR